MLRKTLFAQLLGWFVWLAPVLSIGLSVYGSRMIYQFNVERLGDDLEARAQLCLREIDRQYGQVSQAALDHLCKQLGDLGDARLTVVAGDGGVLADSRADATPSENLARRPDVAEALGGAATRKVRPAGHRYDEAVAVALPLVRQGKVAAVVRMTQSEASLTHSTGRMLPFVLMATLISGGVLALACWLAARRLSRALAEITAGVKRLGRGALDQRLPTFDLTELQQLADELNHAASNLEHHVERIALQERRHQAMLFSMDEGVLAFDREGFIISANDACAALLETEADRLHGRRVYEVVRKPDLVGLVEKALAEQGPAEADVLFRGATDRWVHVHATTLYDAQRRRVGGLLLLHDVTRLRRLESVRRDFVANVSHELRTPITSIKGFMETLLDGALDDRDNAERFMRIILRQVNRLNAIIDDLLALSRIERGSEEQAIPLKSQPVREIVASAMEMCGQKAHDKSMELLLACPDDLTAAVNGPLLEQAVVNLIDNAVKYSGAGKKVWIRVAVEADKLAISVRDEGCGIEAKHLPRLFERFYRVDKARSREQGGTGLGLAIVKHIALAHQGSVAVESVVGQGSTFVVRLPLAASNATAPSADSPIANPEAVV